MHILLDVDGVVIRDRLLMTHVKSNVENYVRKRFPHVKDPKKFNQSLYTNWGHTRLGLQDMFPKEDFSDFDTKVYDRDLVSHLESHLKTDKFILNSKMPINELYNDYGHDVILFSNAPLSWTAPVAWALDVRCEVYLPTKNNLLKPDPRIYEDVTRGLKGPFILVDDNTKNLIPVLENPDFIPFHFSDKFCGVFPTIQSIGELRVYLN